MAIISSYPSDNNIQPGDSWASSDAGTRRTRKISVSGLADYLNSSGSLVVAGQMAFKYVSFPDALPGTFRKTTADSTVDITWDSFPVLEVSKFDAAYTDISPVIEYLVGEQIMLSSTSNKGNFGHYRITSYNQASTQDFYTLELEYLGSNGTLTIDKSYNITKFSLERDDKLSDKRYVHNQLASSSEWTITHNLEKYVSVTVVDSAGTTVIGDVEHVDINTVKLTFTSPFSGEAYMN